jgi:putative thioredoxin
MRDFNRDVIEASRQQPVLVDFYATWCGPCKMLAPVLEAAVTTAARPVKLVKIDTDANQELAVGACVSGIPDVRLYIGGKQVASFTGFRSKPAVEQFLSDNLASGRT